MHPKRPASIGRFSKSDDHPLEDIAKSGQIWLEIKYENTNFSHTFILLTTYCNQL
jgi:hypothetical protein